MFGLAAFAVAWFLLVGASAAVTRHPLVLGDEAIYYLSSLFGYSAENFARWELIDRIPNLLYYRVYSLLPERELYLASKWLNAAFVALAAAPVFLVARLLVPSCASAAFAAVVIAAPTATFARYFMPESLYFFGFWCVVAALLSSLRKSLARACLLAGASAGLLSLVKPHGIALALGIALFLVLRAGSPKSRWLSASGFLAAFLVIRANGSYALTGAWAVSMGPTYGDLAITWPSLPAILFSLSAHAAALALLAGIPLAIVAAAVVRSPPLEPALRDCALLSLCILAALLGMTAYFSAVVFKLSPETHSLARLHGRYYAFALPLAMLAYAAMVHRQSVAIPRPALRLGIGSMAVSAAILMCCFDSSILDFAELSLAVRRWDGLVLLATAGGLSAGLAWMLRKAAITGAPAVVLLPLAWWTLLLACTSVALVGGQLAGRAPKPTAVDQVMMEDPRLRALVGREDGLVVALAGSNLEAYRALFHLSSRARGRLVGPGTALRFESIPADVGWLLLLPGVSYAGRGTTEEIGPVRYVRLRSRAGSAPSFGKQAEHAVQPHEVERVVGLRLHHGLGVVGDAGAGLGHHGQVVGAVADRDHSLPREPQLALEPRDVARLAGGVDERSRRGSRQPAALGHQHVGIGVVELQAVAHAVGEIGEAARDQKRLHARAPRRGDQGFSPGIEAKALGVDALERVFLEPRERGDPPLEALGPVDLAAHGRRGHGGHLGLAPREVGDLVDALDADERGIHVHREQAEVGEARALAHEAEVQAGLPAVVANGFAGGGVGVGDAERACRDPLDRLAPGERVQRLQVRGGDFLALDDQVHGRAKCFETADERG